MAVSPASLRRRDIGVKVNGKGRRAKGKGKMDFSFVLCPSPLAFLLLFFPMQPFQYLFDIPSYQLQRNPKLLAGGHWRQGNISHLAVAELVDLQYRIAIQLHEKGIGKGNRILLVAEKFSLTWLATDMARNTPSFF